MAGAQQQLVIKGYAASQLCLVLCMHTRSILQDIDFLICYTGVKNYLLHFILQKFICEYYMSYNRQNIGEVAIS